MQQRITLTIQEDEHLALQAIAQHEKRHPRQQAALLLRYALERAGYLQSHMDEGVNAAAISQQGESHEP